MTPAGRRSTTFPALTAVEASHSARLKATVLQAIAANQGWLAFSDYQQIVLYEPGLGYYSAGAQKFGVAGDFTTAPELSPLFSRAVARQALTLMGAMDFSVLEFGAGSGAMAGVLMQQFAAARRLPQQYAILEVSADLRERQRDYLASQIGGFVSRAQWLSQLPSHFAGMIVANEVLDALPCERFVIRQGEPWALGLRATAAELEWQLRDPRTTPLAAQYATLATQLAVLPAPLTEGYLGEFMPTLPAFVSSLAAILGRGAILLIDYGIARRQLYHPDRHSGTLQCYRRHHAHEDPLQDMGLSDISAWVDFSAVASAALAAGLELHTYCTQMAWLLEQGIEADLAATMAAARDDVARLQLAQGVKSLLLPGEMGETVKVMCLTKGLPQSDSARLQDLRDSL